MPLVSTLNQSRQKEKNMLLKKRKKLLGLLKLSFPSRYFCEAEDNMMVITVKAQLICSITKHSITSPTLMSLNFSTCMPHS